MACGRGLQHADADDLAQQVFLSVAKAIEAWEPDSRQPPFRVWLSRITRNAIVNALTRRKPDAPGGSTSEQEMLPVLPGFTAGLFTKPLDSRLAFFAASGICTVLLLASLCIIRNRVRYGRFNAPVIAWCASVIASYAAYSFMRT